MVHNCITIQVQVLAGAGDAAAVNVDAGSNTIDVDIVASLALGTAAGDGAIAATNACRYLQSKE